MLKKFNRYYVKVKSKNDTFFLAYGEVVQNYYICGSLDHAVRFENIEDAVAAYVQFIHKCVSRNASLSVYIRDATFFRETVHAIDNQTSFPDFWEA